MTMDTSNSGQVQRQGLESFGLNHQQYGTTRSSAIPPPYNLSRFYGMGEDPWVAKTSIVPPADPHNGQQMQGMINYNSNGTSFQNFRTRTIASECDTTPDDSGYGSIRAPYSIENTSVYEGESNPEAHNTASLMESLHLCQGSIQNNQSSSWTQQHPNPSISTTPTGTDQKYFCPRCQSWLRTKSELNKHELRHNKPFRCEVPGCPRQKGFGTKNDLDRHKRSVHSDLTVSGPRYVCSLEQCATRDSQKIWPRADNFRSHLRRIHNKELAADADLEEYICHDVHTSKDSGPSQPALREDLQGVGGMSYMISNPSMNAQKPIGSSFPPSFLSSSQSMVTDSNHGIPDIDQDLDSLLQNSTSPTTENMQSGLESAQEPDQGFMQSDTLHEASQGALKSRRALDNQRIPLPNSRLHYTCRNQDDVQDVRDISMGNTSMEPIDTITKSSERLGRLDNPLETDVARLEGPETARSKLERSTAKAADAKQKEDELTSNLPSGLDILMLLKSESTDKVLECLKHLPKSILNRALEASDDVKSSSSQESTTHKNSHQCTECPKTFNRACELKKHLKRHEKPYGCTFLSCPKSFGSKNDWKRHESSQHWQLETWKCEETKSNQTEPCGKVCQRRESFRNHLNKEHTITDSKEVDEKLEKCRVGRHCDTRFWCGFCQKIVEIDEEGVNAWTKRCDHIDNHFCGRDGPKMNICKWKHLEDEEPEKDRSETSSESSSKQLGLSPGSSSASSPSSSLKRKLGSEGGDTGPYKKQRHEGAYLWICCQCQEYHMMKTTGICLSCNHSRCKDYCTIDVIDKDQDTNS